MKYFFLGETYWSVMWLHSCRHSAVPGGGVWQQKKTTSTDNSVTNGEEVDVLWNRSEMQGSEFIASLEPQNICLSSLFFLRPSGSERGPSCFHFLHVLSVLGISLCFISLLYLNEKLLWEGIQVVCMWVWVWAVDIKTGPSPKCYQIFHIFLDKLLVPGN